MKKDKIKFAIIITVIFIALSLIILGIYLYSKNTKKNDVKMKIEEIRSGFNNKNKAIKAVKDFVTTTCNCEVVKLINEDKDKFYYEVTRNDNVIGKYALNKENGDIIKEIDNNSIVNPIITGNEVKDPNSPNIGEKPDDLK